MVSYGKPNKGQTIEFAIDRVEEVLKKIIFDTGVYEICVSTLNNGYFTTSEKVVTVPVYGFKFDLKSFNNKFKLDNKYSLWKYIPFLLVCIK